MFTLCCTAKLRRHLGLAAEPELSAHQTFLGDWYANLLPWRPAMALCVNADTRFALIVDLDECGGARDLGDRLVRRLFTALREMKVSEPVIRRVLDDYKDVRIATTRNRSVLGTMNDLMMAAEHWLEGAQDEAKPLDRHELERRLNEMPHSPLGGENARKTLGERGTG